MDITKSKHKYTTLKSGFVSSVDEFVNNYYNFTDEIFKHMINPMVLEMSNTFKRKKNAWELQNTKYRQIGSLDMQRIYAYKTSDNIFRKKKYMPKGKNHGIVILCDFSGSMDKVLPMVFVNAIAITMFCKQQKIPCEVLTFTSQQYRVDQMETIMKNNSYSTDMLRLMDNNTSVATMKQIFLQMLFEMVAFPNFTPTAKLKVAELEQTINIKERTLKLSGTPLASGMMGAMERAAFLTETCEQVSIITISDGAGNMKLFHDKTRSFTCPHNSRMYSVDEVKNSAYKNSEYINFAGELSSVSPGLIEPLFVNHMIKDLGITSIQINLTTSMLLNTYPINMIENNEVTFDEFNNELNHKGQVSIENILGFDKVVFIKQKIFEDIFGAANLKNSKLGVEEKPPTKSDLKRALATIGNEDKVLKIVASTVVTEICKNYH